MSPRRLLALEKTAIDADLAHRQARGRFFLAHVGESGQYHQAVFKEIDADAGLVELERNARYLKAEVKVAWNRVTNATNQKTSWWLWFLPKPGPEETTE